MLQCKKWPFYRDKEIGLDECVFGKSPPQHHSTRHLSNLYRFFLNVITLTNVKGCNKPLTGFGSLPLFAYTTPLHPTMADLCLLRRKPSILHPSVLTQESWFFVYNCATTHFVLLFVSFSVPYVLLRFLLHSSSFLQKAYFLRLAAAGVSG